MRKLSVFILISAFIMSTNLYTIDLIEDTVEFIFDDLAKVIGIIVIVGLGFYLLKKIYKKYSDSDNNDRK